MSEKRFSPCLSLECVCGVLYHGEVCCCQNYSFDSLSFLSGFWILSHFSERLFQPYSYTYRDSLMVSSDSLTILISTSKFLKNIFY